MRVRFLQNWLGCLEGRDYEIPDGQANILLRRKIVELVVVDPVIPEPPKTKGKK